ncbi:MAG: hypothetical protein JWN15_1974, partial [Firmicutes bacterium]|nr:hypothetical protein [Bacillota bacterium]
MLTVNDVLSIRHPEAPRWSPDGAWLAFHYIVDGATQLNVVPAGGGELVRLSAADAGAWDWASDGRVAWAEGPRVMAARPGAVPGAGSGAGPGVLLDGQAPVGDLKWSPDGRMLAVSRGGKLILLGGQPLLHELSAPGPVLDFWWSPDSACIAMLFLDGSQWDAGVVHVASRQLTWRSRTRDWEHGLAWLGSDKLSVVRISEDASMREYLVVDLKDGSEEVLERETSPR